MSQSLDVTVLSSASRTATTSATFTWADAKGVLVLVMSSHTATPGLTPKLLAYDPVSGTYWTLWTAASAITADGTYVYMFSDEGSPPSGGSITESVQVALTPDMKVTITHVDADAAVYSVGFNRVNL